MELILVQVSEGVSYRKSTVSIIFIKPDVNVSV